MRKLLLILTLIAVTFPVIAEAQVVHHYRHHHRHYHRHHHHHRHYHHVMR